jgi:undecaprenyl phosphate N,N'-diacetylbacillosamine 1-phosphate transferase
VKNTFYSKILKRFIDFNLSIISLVLLSPLFLFVSLLQFFLNGLPIFFLQKRIGKNGKIFNLIKFRTMNNNRFEGKLLPDYKRVTWFGSLLRITSIDELPSLVNILVGQMSIVGPRPLLVEYLPLYNNEQKKRNLVRPGLTGLAQVNGRNSISWVDKFNYDLYYVKNITVLLDLKIILLTIIVVFFKTNTVNKSKNNTNDKFTGND